MRDAAVAIGFVIAMPMEAKVLVKRLGLRPAPDIGGKAWRGELDGRPVAAIVTGMGTALARTGATRLLDATEPTRVVAFGISGGVDSSTEIGTLIRPAKVVNSATGDELAPAPLGPEPMGGTLWTTDLILAGPAVADLKAQGVVGLDMETAAVGAVCDARSTPWSVVRAISDGPSDEVDEEVFRLSNQDGTPNAKNIAKYVAKHPGRIPHMARMGRHVQLAVERVTEAAIEGCRTQT